MGRAGKPLAGVNLHGLRTEEFGSTHGRLGGRACNGLFADQFSGSSWGSHHGHKGVGLRPRPGEKGDSGRGLRRRAMAPVDSRGWPGPDRRRPRRRVPTAAPALGR